MAVTIQAVGKQAKSVNIKFTKITEKPVKRLFGLASGVTFLPRKKKLKKLGI